MATTSSRRSSSGPVLRSLSPSGRFHTANTTSCFNTSSAFAWSTSSSFSSSSSKSGFFSDSRDNHHCSLYNSHQRSASPTRVNLYSSPSVSAPSFRFSIDRPISPNRSISVSKKNHHHSISSSFQKKTCMCSPTTHPGSFRCSLHKNVGNSNQSSSSYPSNRLNMRRSAMTNSLVRIGGVEGEWMKRSLRDLIRPSSHHQRRREGFQPRPSRLSIMSKS